MATTIDYALFDKIISVIERRGEVCQYDIEREIYDNRLNIGVHLRTLCESGKVMSRETGERYERGSAMYSIANGKDNPFDNSSLCDKVLSFIKQKNRISEDYLKNSIAEFRQDDGISRLRKYLAPLIASKKITREWGWIQYLGE